MEHTNLIAVKILEDEYYDYKHNEHHKWHYDRQYKMLVTAIERAQEEIKLNPSEPHLPLGDVMLSLPDIRNKLTPINNLIEMLENSENEYHHVYEVDVLIRIEIENCKESIRYLSGNGA